MAQGKRKRTSTAPDHSNDEQHADGADHTEMDEAPVAPLSECPFTVEYRSAAKKASLTAKKAKNAKQAKMTTGAKRQKGAATKAVTGPPPKQELDQTLPEDMNSTVFTIKPKAKWDSLKKYRNFVGMCGSFVFFSFRFMFRLGVSGGLFFLSFF